MSEKISIQTNNKWRCIVRCTHSGRGQVGKGILIQSPVALKCIPESEKTTHWAGEKKLGFFSIHA